jgi:hypothetical protein
MSRDLLPKGERSLKPLKSHRAWLAKSWNLAANMEIRYRLSSVASSDPTANSAYLSPCPDGTVGGIFVPRSCAKTQFDRQGPGSHEIWRQARTGTKVTIPHHSGDMAEGTLRAILRGWDKRKRLSQGLVFRADVTF